MATNEEVIMALSNAVNFSFTDKTSFGALFGGAGSSSSSVVAKGIGNTAFGGYALSSVIETSKNNSAFGYRSQLSTEGDGNTSFGFESMLFNALGNHNTAFGAFTFADLSLGNGNSAFGSGAGKNITTGTGNICLGELTGVSKGDISNSIVLGRFAEATKSNQLVIGSTIAPVGNVTTETLQSTSTLSVLINGVERKILLA